MSEYGSSGPQGSYGPPGASGPVTPRPASDPAHFVMITNYVAVGLGVLGFVWGFLTWFSQDVGGAGIPGYYGLGAAAIGLSLAAGFVAGAAVIEKRDITLVPAALAAAAVLVLVGQLIKHGEGLGAGIGLILALVTTILQTGALIYGWLLASGRMSVPSSSPKPAQNQWPGQQGAGQQSAGQQSAGQQGGYGYPQGNAYPGPGQYQQPSYPGPNSQSGQYGPPSGQAPSAPSPQGGQSGNTYGPPSGGGYAPPQSSQPQSGATSSMPAQGASPYGSPSPGPGQDGTDEGGYGEATRHIPRYTGPGASNPDEQSGN